MEVQVLQAQSAALGFDRMTGTGFDPQTHRSLENALITEGHSGRQAALAQLGCGGDAHCAAAYDFYRLARFMFIATVQALGTTLAAGQVTDEELNLVGGAGSAGANQYRIVRAVVDAVLVANCGARNGCVAEFGGMEPILTEVLAFLATNHIEGVELTVPIWPGPPVNEGAVAESFPEAEQPQEQAPPPPVRRKKHRLKLDITGFLLGRGRPRPQPDEAPPEQAEEPPVVAEVIDEGLDDEPPDTDLLPFVTLPEGQNLVLFDDVKMMGPMERVAPGVNGRKWGGRKAPQMSVIPALWRAMEVGWAESHLGSTVEPTTQIPSRTNFERIRASMRAARREAEATSSFITSETLRTHVTDFTMEVYHICRVRFERYAAALENAWARGRNGVPDTIGDGELLIATGRERPQVSSTCLGKDVAPVFREDAVIADNANCIFIHKFEEVGYRALRADMGAVITGARSKAEVRARIVAHLMAQDPRLAATGQLRPRFVHYRLIPPPPAGAHTFQAVRAEVGDMGNALAPGFLRQAAGLLMVTPGVHLPPRPAQPSTRRQPAMLHTPAGTFDLSALASAPRLHAGLELVDKDEALAQELAALKINVLALAEACTGGDPAACKGAASMGQQILALSARIAREADDPKGVVTRALELSEDKGEDRGLIDKAGDFFESINPITRVKAFFEGTVSPTESIQGAAVSFGDRIENIVRSGAKGMAAVSAIGLLMLLLLIVAMMWLVREVAPHGARTAENVLNFQRDALDKAPAIIESVVPVRSAFDALRG